MVSICIKICQGKFTPKLPPTGDIPSDLSTGDIPSGVVDIIHKE